MQDQQPLIKPKSIPLVLKLSTMISMLVIGGIAIVSVVMLSRHNQLQTDQINDFGSAMVLQFAGSATEPLFTGDYLSLEVMVKKFQSLPRVTGITILDKQLKVVAKSGDQASAEAIRQLIEEEALPGPHTQPVSEDGILAVTAPVMYRDVIGGHIYILLQTNTLMYSYMRNLIVILFIVGIVAICALWVSYRISRYISRPINELLDATDRISEGKYDVLTNDRRNDEMGRLLHAINDMGQGLLKKNQVEALLNNFLAKDVATRVIEQLDTVSVGGERVEATVLFADIVGFTSMSEKLSPEEVGEFLNETFSYLNICSKLYFGTIDKFIGDCAMVVFGTPKTDVDHRMHAVACAVLMQKLSHNINMVRARENKPLVQLRIGINTGKMLAGIVGTQDKMEYTVVGDSVNLASRLCNEAQAGQIITTQDVHDALISDGKIVASQYKKLRVRGKEDMVTTYLIEGVRKEYQLTINSLIEDVLDGMKA